MKKSLFAMPYDLDICLCMCYTVFSVHEQIAETITLYRRVFFALISKPRTSESNQ